MVFLSKWALERGFLNYINENENIVLQNLKEDLELHYQNNGSWKQITQSSDAWREFFFKGKRKRREIFRPSDLSSLPAANQIEKRPLKLHGGMLYRIRLLDTEHNILMGYEAADKKATVFELKTNDSVIGYLSFNPTVEIAIFLFAKSIPF